MVPLKYRAVLRYNGVARAFRDVHEAERFARRRCRVNGDTFEIESLVHGGVIAAVSRDNANRVWTDVRQFQNPLL